ncbi:chemotaxis response regulator protein-glutamate methylesterase [Nibricoccus sp. IMCC34717]|uniref:protein-glutamate methylesterase/protein-glutamine glutaminase n=1 Tax=Nibricoccus sp. IMCC34717 TaxID=3034021 RepID=UPI00384B2B57
MPKLRVLIVDDSTVMRRLVSEAVGRDPDLEVVGTAAHGRIALAKVQQTTPDVIVLDVEMPELDGLETLRELRKTHPKLPVIMCSTLTSRGAITTLEALAAGATDYVTKPSQVTNPEESIAKLSAELVPKIKIHRKLPPLAAPVKAVAPKRPGATSDRAGPSRIDLVAIATSTGGPNALAEVVKGLPAQLEVPIVCVQHMPPVFTQLLAERLTAHKTVVCVEGAEGMAIQPGHFYIAPGGRHMEVHRETPTAPLTLRLTDAPPENSCRPAADVLFRSVAQHVGARTLAVVLTGMGQDGLRGCELIRERGGYIVAQDEATSVVWGMPGYVVQQGVADRVLPLALVAPEITRRVRTGVGVTQSPFQTACR